MLGVAEAVEPVALPALRHLVVESGDPAFFAAVDCPALTHLTLRHLTARPAPTEDIRAIGALRGLRALSLGFAVDDLAPLAGLGGLRALELAATEAPVDLDPLRACARLERLRCWGRVASLEPLVGLPIAALLVDGDGLDFEPLTRMPTLRALEVRCAPPPPTLWARLPGLRFVGLYEMDDVDLAPLAALPALEQIDVFGSSTRPERALPGVWITAAPR